MPPLEVKSWTVEADPGGIRVDRFIRSCLPHLSLRQIHKAIDEGAFWLGSGPARKGEILFSGDVITLRDFPHLLAEGPLPAWDLEIPVLYEDDSLLVLDKPAGLATHGSSGRETGTVANFIAAFRPSCLSVGKSRWEPGLVHRLDEDTSGVLLVAKDQTAFENLRRQFRQRTVEKKYLALVRGRTKWEGVIDYSLARDPKDRRKMRAIVRGKDGARKWMALTRYRLLDEAAGFSFLEIEIRTGVSHQIRVHLAAIGHPLVGDELYGEPLNNTFELRRHFLHAWRLSFRHPRSGRRLVVESPLPEELGRVLARLRIDPPQKG